MTNDHLSLIGFSGSGKTTVARLIADRLGWDYVDTDSLIEARAGKSIPRIFAEDGEGAFREHETAVVASLVGREKIVVATGGGVVVVEASRRALFESGVVLCLEASPETIIERVYPTASLTQTERPMVNQAARVRPLKAQRAPLYALADFTLHTDVLTPEQAADEVVRLYQTYGAQALARPGRAEAVVAAPSPSFIDAPGSSTIVRTASGDYPAYVEWGALEQLGAHTKRATRARRAFVVSDENVVRAWGETAVSSLRGAGLETSSYILPPGDGSKSLENAGLVYEWLASQRAERRDVVVALGGGMVDDFAGFIAGTYLRGMPVVQAPTSLLAMVDASIGGKTAINQAGAKNLVGLFYQPKAVVADVATLKTLPRRALVEGLGEIVKHALIRDESLLEMLESRLDDLLDLEPELTTEIVRRNVQIKAAVVSEDERETGGVREILNYGHTLGHAFEAAGGYDALLHGEAVSVGMQAAAEIGVRIGVTPRSLLERQTKLLERTGLPLRPPPGLDKARVRAALALDKKVVAGGQRWVLLEGVGRPIVTADVPADVVESVIDYFLS